VRRNLDSERNKSYRFTYTFSCTSVCDFLKRTGLAYLNAGGYASLHETARRLAEFEGFLAHANAITKS